MESTKAALESVEAWARSVGRDPSWDENPPLALYIAVNCGPDSVPATVTATEDFLVVTVFGLDELPPAPHDAEALALIAQINLSQVMTKIGVDAQSGEVRAKAVTQLCAHAPEASFMEVLVADLEWVMAAWTTGSAQLLATLKDPSDQTS